MTRLDAIRRRLEAATVRYVYTTLESHQGSGQSHFSIPTEHHESATRDLRDLLEGIDIMGRWIADPIRMSNYRSNAETYVKSRNVDGLYYIIREMLDDCQRVNNVLSRLDAPEVEG